MRLLILTQKVDKEDPILGFFHAWIQKFAEKFERLTVVCLELGSHALPVNVEVRSLGKERGGSKLLYTWRFYKHIFAEKDNYDAVFVHMNQEYVLLGGLFWRCLGKKIYLWRNHAKGDWKTRLAVVCSDKVFYTSPASYTARFKRSVQMPVGVDTDFFKPSSNAERMPHSVLLLGRISPVKKVLEFIEWIKNTDYTATIAGPILPKDKKYGEAVKRHIAKVPRIKYVGPVDQEGALKLYQTHEICANKTPKGSFDKTILEALASGCKIVADNSDVHGIRVEDHSLDKLAERLAAEIR